MISKVTSKFQTTIPQRIRQKLNINTADTIVWEIEDNRVVILDPLKVRQSKRGGKEMPEECVKYHLPEFRLPGAVAPYFFRTGKQGILQHFDCSAELLPDVCFPGTSIQILPPFTGSIHRH